MHLLTLEPVRSIMVPAIYSFLLLAITSLIVASPTPSSHLKVEHTARDLWDDLTGNVTAQYKLYGFVGCSKDEKNAIYAAFREKDQILKTKSVRKLAWNSAAAIDYLG
jgi:hypothetical protein